MAGTTEVFGPPIVANGVLYVVTLGGRLLALDMKTGQEMWQFKAGGEIWESATIHDGVVYFGADDRFLYAVR